MDDQERPTLDDIKEPPGLESVSTEPDARTRDWRDTLDRDLGNLQYKQATQDLGQRRLYARLLFGLLVVWLVCILTILMLQGWGGWGFKLADSVMIAALGTTTGNVIALFVVVARYIFPRDKPPKS